MNVTHTHKHARQRRDRTGRAARVHAERHTLLNVIHRLARVGTPNVEPNAHVVWLDLGGGAKGGDLVERPFECAEHVGASEVALVVVGRNAYSGLVGGKRVGVSAGSLPTDGVTQCKVRIRISREQLDLMLEGGLGVGWLLEAQVRVSKVLVAKRAVGIEQEAPTKEPLSLEEAHLVR